MVGMNSRSERRHFPLVAKADHACNGQLNVIWTAGLSPTLRGIAVSAFAQIPLSNTTGGGLRNKLSSLRCTLNVFLQDASACYERA